MCVICLSKKGVRQPNKNEIRDMWDTNPHGAGYMFVRNGNVEIRKGFMTLKDFMRSVQAENFTDDDVVVYHFRISTQAGVTPEMTHPFPLSPDLADMKLLECTCSVGIAHNGIIRLTSTKDKEYSDTALFITEYLPMLIRDTQDITDKRVKKTIKALALSKLVLLNGEGDVAVIGDFWADGDGLMFSNRNFMPTRYDFPRTWKMGELYSYRYKTATR
jgi:predicted glutamine amidotransferase